MKFLKQFLRDEGGTTAVEYAVMIALILILLIMGVRATGAGSTGYWGKSTTELNNVGF